MNRPRLLVIDASTAIAAHWPEPHRPAARRVLDAVADGHAQAIAPQLWSAECANGCWKRVARGHASAADALESYRRIAKLPVTLIDTAHLSEPACMIALELGITVYDALYVATALFARATLVTLDASLVEKVRAVDFSVSITHARDYSA